MATIANQWTGNGLADGVALTNGNVNTTGNGPTVVRSVSGTPTMVTSGNGFLVTTTASSDLARIDVTLASASKSVVTQMTFTVPMTPDINASILNVRNSSGNVAFLNVNLARQIELVDVTGIQIASRSPAVAIGDKLLADMVVSLNPTPTTSNGRIFFRVKNLTNPAWGTSGEFFYDSGYTFNLGTADITGVRFGKVVPFTIPAPGMLFEHLGWQGATVATTDTSVAAAKAYFADAPVAPTPVVSPLRRWNGASYTAVRPYRWTGTAYVPLDVL